MNNKIIGIVIGVLILGVVIFSGINSPELSPSMELNFKDKIKSTGLTNPEVMPTSTAFAYRQCPGGIEFIPSPGIGGGPAYLSCKDRSGVAYTVECVGYRRIELNGGVGC